MFENIFKFFKKAKKEEIKSTDSKSAAKERLQLVLMQDRANVSADFLDLMRHEIIEVIKKYIDVDENSIDVRLTNIENEDGTNGAPALYANIPILNIKNEARKVDSSKIKENKDVKSKENKEEIKKQEEVKREENVKKENAKKDDVKEDKKENNKKEEKQEEVKIQEKVKSEENVKKENAKKDSVKEDSKENKEEKKELTTENK